MAVAHLRLLQRQPRAKTAQPAAGSKESGPDVVAPFRAGYEQCISDAQTYLDSHCGGLICKRSRLVQHLDDQYRALTASSSGPLANYPLKGDRGLNGSLSSDCQVSFIAVQCNCLASVVAIGSQM